MGLTLGLHVTIAATPGGTCDSYSPPHRTRYASNTTISVRFRLTELGEKVYSIDRYMAELYEPYTSSPEDRARWGFD